jgi:HlyD family secretion protein
MIKRILAVLLVLPALFLGGCSGRDSADKNIYTGTVESDSFYISSQVSGQVSDVLKSQGDMIKSGDMVARVDSKAYELQKSQAEGALKSAEAKQSLLPGKAGTHLKDEAEGAVQQARAAVELAGLQVNRCSITTLNGGIITDVLVNRGEFVSAGMNIMRASNPEEQYIRIYVEESKRSSIKTGKILDIYLENRSIIKGTVIYISQESEFTPKNVETKDEKQKTLFEIKIKLDDTSETVPGMLVDVKVD